MANAAIDDLAQGKGEPRPYAPSWLDRFNAWLVRLPGPSWAYYLGIWLVLVLLQNVTLWGEGAYPAGTFLPNHTAIAALIPFLLALSHFLDSRAGAALATLRPAMEVGEEEYRRLRYQLATLPAFPTLLVSLIGVASIVMLNVMLDSFGDFGGLGAFPISRTLIYLMYVGAWWVVAAFLYHTIHQLRTINLIYTHHTRVNLFKMRPLYGLSGVTALTGVSLTAITYGWMVSTRSCGENRSPWPSCSPSPPWPSWPLSGRSLASTGSWRRRKGGCWTSARRILNPQSPSCTGEWTARGSRGWMT
jgi:hypothetical protein